MDIQASVGEPFEVVVEQYATAGYAWQVTMPSGVRQLEEADPPGTGGPPGSPQRRRLRFVADRAGEFEIVLALKRAWESQAIERRTVRVRVRPD